MPTKKNYENLPYTEPDDTSESLYFKFRSWPDFLSNLELRIKGNISYTSHSSSSGRYESRFHSHRTLESALEEVKKEKVLDQSKSNEIYETVKNHIKLKIGDEPMAGIDIPAYLSGQPECFEQFVPKGVKTRKKKVKEIFVMIGANCDTNGSELSDYVKEVMEKIYRNFLFEKVVISVASSWGWGEQIHQVYIDIPFRDVGYLLRTGYADFFRRLMFVYHEQHRDCPYNYGKSMCEDISDLRKLYPKGAVIVSFGHRSEIDGIK